MGNKMILAKKVFRYCGLDITAVRIKYRTSMFIKTAYGF